MKGLNFQQVWASHRGGVCSAKFWLIAFDFAIKIINTYNIEGNGYADDCSALYGGKNLELAISKLQKMLDSLTAWGRRCGLHFNPQKSVAVVFTRSRKTPLTNLKIDGKDIPYKQEVKYLGVTMDSKLYWNKHISERIAKAKKVLHAVAAITRKNWGPKPRLMRWAYLSMVRPIISYASLVWAHRAPFLANKLRSINRMAMNTFGVFPRSTPTIALETMLDVLPLHLFCKKEALASRIRLDDVLQFGWNGTAKRKTHAVSHMLAWQRELQSIRLEPTASDGCNVLHWGNQFRLNKDSFSGRKKHRQLSQYNIFSDGSKRAGQVGSGFVITKHKQTIQEGKYRLPDCATVFQAEIAAVQKAVQELQKIPTTIRYVKISVSYTHLTLPTTPYV